jgi:hypothetical protein
MAKTRRTLYVAVAEQRDNRPFSAAELRDRQERLAKLSEFSVQAAYRKAHEACRMEVAALGSPACRSPTVQLPQLTSPGGTSFVAESGKVKVRKSTKSFRTTSICSRYWRALP